MKLGVEEVPGCADPLCTLTGENRIHLLEHRSQPVGARSLRLDSHGALDAVDSVEPFTEHRLPGVNHPAFDLARRALAVVVKVGECALVAILNQRELSDQLARGGLTLG